MNTIALNRQQIDRLNEIARHFHEVKWFTLVEENSSGIGPTVAVKFNAFGDQDKDAADTTVNMTDVSTW